MVRTRDLSPRSLGLQAHLGSLRLATFGQADTRMHLFLPTTNDVESAESDVAETVEWTLPCLLLQLLHQDAGLLIHHFQKVSQNREVEGGSQHLSPFTPL